MATTERDLADIHEWVSIDVDGETYQFDLTFLTSSWQCIFGAGCPGIGDRPAPELEHGCCTHGAHFHDKPDRRRVERLIEQLTDAEWQLRAVAEAAGGAVAKDEDGAWVTRTHDGACIMLNRPDFAAGAGCALHAAALAREERPIDWKPYVCWQLPLRLDFHVDDHGHTTNMLREWKRRDWGPGGDEFHWWCTESPEAFVGREPVFVSLREDIVELVGQPAYDALVAHLDALPVEQLLPHPARRPRRTQPASADHRPPEPLRAQA